MNEQIPEVSGGAIDVPAGADIAALIDMICHEHKEAVKKHPFFAHVLADNREGLKDRVRLQLKEERKQLRREVAQKKVIATSVMRTEYCEFLEAYYNGDYDHCLQELAQCGAVILRMMQMLPKEKQKMETEK